jgi:hypothetical protein
MDLSFNGLSKHPKATKLEGDARLSLWELAGNPRIEVPTTWVVVVNGGKTVKQRPTKLAAEREYELLKDEM